MRRAITTSMVLSAAVLTLALIAAPASAGGAWLEFDAASYAPGDTVEATADVGSGTQGWTGDGPFHVHLRPMDGADDLSEPLATAELSPRDGRSVRLAVTFVVPDVEPGEWFLEVCNAGCERGLGDLVGGILTVHAAPLDELPETGGPGAVGLLGLVMLVAGTAVITRTRPRSRAAGTGS